MTFALDTPLDLALDHKEYPRLQKAFGMQTVGDLLMHYPRRYLTRGALTPIWSLPVGEHVTIVAEVRSVSVRSMRERRGKLLEVVIGDGADELALTFFGQEWRKNELLVGRRGMFSGKVGVYKRARQLSNPDYEMFDAAAPTNVEDWATELIPVYPATSSVASNQIRRAVDVVLGNLGMIEDPLPTMFAATHGLMDPRSALVGIHQPRDMKDVKKARTTLRMQEALLLQLALLQQRATVRAMSSIKRPGGSLLERFDEQLAFALTPDQEAVGEVIAKDLVGDWPMNRLVQGEVGSGKTLVALRAMLQVAQSGGQSALIAPTEVLAAQHLRSLAKMLGPQLAPELMPTLLTGQMPAAERRKAALRVAAGQARIVVGTHALLSESTTFADLGLVVVDEQHRFGVEQRETLRAKGTTPHALVLTATPIPRTVAMTVFGDLDVSTIRTMPTGRAGISTFVAPLAEKPTWWERVWERVAEEVAKGYQAFVVSSAIDVEAKTVTEEDPVEIGVTTKPRWGVVQVEHMLRSHPAFANIRLEILHGRLHSDEKDRIMRAFAAGDIDVLVATTVIEVGVDVANASTMVILDAERFGVSQLHQLRGRVGRGSVPGLCLLVTEAEFGTPGRQRVEAVAETLDGFELAEEDLLLRGEGDVLGDMQSGSRSSLKLLRVVKDSAMIATAREFAEELVSEDPFLLEYPALEKALKQRVSAEERAALGKG